ncbi:DUF917-domain-containing protein [Dendrothele bispora CBS 962.96]|uniref:DUF917-domain-containing protein n=1 Tax=Dendrothele bispora (strain CBS 962.96) TaxID=1314807 RepID=A0A4S8LDE4_DENBC|nr:DUF917-domain-containing protein [Dendrothele bispora CBS 962.96]
MPFGALFGACEALAAEPDNPDAKAFLPRLRDDGVEDASSALVANGEDDDQMIIPFQNENLAAYVEKRDGSRSMVAIVPDLIAVLDSQSGSHLGTQMYSYGLRVTVIALAGSPLWTTEAGLECGGPSAFGLSDTYVPIGEYITPNVKLMKNVKKTIQLHTLVPLAPFTRPIKADAVGTNKGTSETDVKTLAVDTVVKGPEDGWPGVQP